MASYLAPILVTTAFLAAALGLVLIGQPLYALGFVLLAGFGVAELVETARHNRYMRRFGG